MDEWINHDNMWLRRVAILHQVKFIIVSHIRCTKSMATVTSWYMHLKNVAHPAVKLEGRHRWGQTVLLVSEQGSRDRILHQEGHRLGTQRVLKDKWSSS